MSMYMEVFGAIRVTPAVEPELAERLHQFMQFRHMRRDPELLYELYPSQEEREAHSLLGDGNFGPDGVFFMPEDPDESTNDYTKLAGVCHQADINVPPQGGSSLYCALRLLPDGQGEDCSYLSWDEDDFFGLFEGERFTQYRDFGGWVKFIAELLVQRGHHLDGQMVVNAGNGWKFHLITVRDAQVTQAEFMGGTYMAEHYEALQRLPQKRMEEDEEE